MKRFSRAGGVLVQCYDVALWLTPFSWWPDYVNFVHADAASLAVVQLMHMHNLRRVYKVTVMASDGTCHRWWDMESSESNIECEPV